MDGSPGRSARQHEAEAAPTADLALDLDVPSVSFHDPLHEEEAQAVASLSRRLTRPVELLEDLLGLASRDADAVVLDFDDDLSPARIEPDRDVPRGARVL